jgi:hypothetical protein
MSLHIYKFMLMHHPTAGTQCLATGEKGNKADFSNCPIKLCQDQFCCVLHKFMSGLDLVEMAIALALLGEVKVVRLLTSYMYVYDWTHKPGRT